MSGVLLVMQTGIPKKNPGIPKKNLQTMYCLKYSAAHASNTYGMDADQHTSQMGNGGTPAGILWDKERPGRGELTMLGSILQHPQ